MAVLSSSRPAGTMLSWLSDESLSHVTMKVTP